MSQRAERAAEIKRNLIGYFLNKRNFMFAVSEIAIHAGIADVLAISDKGSVLEVEVKVDWADFNSELKFIKEIANKSSIFDPWRKNQSGKYEKHWIYLRGAKSFVEERAKTFGKHSHEDDIEKWFLPHRFYFVVPPELEERVLAELEGTPYGVLTEWGLSLKPSIVLHKSETPDFIYEKMLRKYARIIHQHSINLAMEKSLQTANQQSIITK